MTRPIPQLAAGWSTGRGRKIYAAKRSAYYAIAKALVLEKYPPGINQDFGPEAPDWPSEMIERRAAKARAIFYDDQETHFREERWRAFISRVARFLMFVDERRGPQNRLPPVDSLQKAYELAERNATLWMERAATLQTAIKARLP